MKALRRAVAAALVSGSLASGSMAADELAEGFANPPADARPLVFWQWVNGNVTQEGIRLDLEWMKRVGLAGAILFDVGFRTPPVPQLVTQRVGFGTAEWRGALAFAASEARRLGLLLGAQSSGGWSVSGGPSVPPERAMKKLVWSEMVVGPGMPIPRRLPELPRNSGPYQDIDIANPEFREPARSGEVAVVAFRLPDAESAGSARPEYTDVAGAALLDDGLYSRALELRPDERGIARLSVTLQSPPRSLVLAARRPLPPVIIEASADGKKFITLDLPRLPIAQASPVTTLSLGETGATHFRVYFTGLDAPLALTEARFESTARLHFAGEKTGYGTLLDYDAGRRSWPPGPAFDPHAVLDLSTRMSADGTLNWRPNRGRWLVQRFGWSLTGRRTVPATPESIGLEVDKLDADAVRHFAESFYDQHAQAMGDAGALALAFSDSWEAGQQNWTPAMFEEFRKRRGYDLLPWLPVLTGRVLGDERISERFLADFRRTLSDLLVNNHYGVIAEVAHRRGMGYVAQAAGTDVPTVIDGIAAKGRVDVPTGEFWIYPPGSEPKPQHIADVREAASAAHLYGKPRVAAESLTSQGEEPWAQGPPQWRPMVDRFFAEGVNQVILHTSAHQPFVDRVPGLSLRQYGQHFTRNETWAGDAGAWVDYIARSSWLLQQGQPVADLAIYLGEGSASHRPFHSEEDQAAAEGFDFDYLNTESLLRMQVRNGRVVLPGGASYRFLFIGRTSVMSLAALKKVISLMREGATVVGFAPRDVPGLAEDADALRELAGGIWGRGKVTIAHGAFGRGHLYARLPDALRLTASIPDVKTGSRSVFWKHRRTADADLYFVTNQTGEAFEGPVEFRVQGRHAELWDAVDGSKRRADYRAQGEATSVTLALAPRASVFVVFRGKPVSAQTPRVVRSNRSPLILDGDWDVKFLDGRGAPASARLEGSWTALADPGIRYYSGRASYAREVVVPAEWLAGDRRVELDLGTVGDLASVRVNGRDLGRWWFPPLRHDITESLRPGGNLLEITVTNYWANRLIGDEQRGAQRQTFTVIRPYTAESPLRPAGLLGPVQLISVDSGDLP